MLGLLWDLALRDSCSQSSSFLSCVHMKLELIVLTLVSWVLSVTTSWDE